MDDRNGEIFDHHAELFAQIGGTPTDADHEALKDFLFEPGGLLQDGGGPSHEWPHFTTENTLLPNTSSLFNNHTLPSELCDDNTSALLDSLVKSLPNYPMPDKQRSIMCHLTDVVPQPLPPLMGHFNNHLPPNVPPLVDEYCKTVPNDYLEKFNRVPNTWNGAISDFNAVQNYPPSQRLSFTSTDKNGNCPDDKVYPSHFIQRLSPSASIESNVRTPTTSYDSVSPLSSNRTPARSDDSISPMGSNHTPLRMEDCMSPAVKLPIKMEESATPTSPSTIKTPNSPNLSNLKTNSPNSSNLKINSPKKSPCSPINTKIKIKEEINKINESKSEVEHDPFVFDPESELKEANVSLKRERKDSTETLIKQKKKMLIPFVAATRIDESLYKASESPSDNVRTNCVVVKDDEHEKTDNLVPEKRKSVNKGSDSKKIKRERNKKVYESIVQPDQQGGIKLKIKVASLIEEPKKRQRKRRSKTHSEEGEDLVLDNVKKGKKSVRFSLASKDVGEQSGWGKDLPPELLERIFGYVVDDDGVVPSLVRLSSVCKQWHDVAIQPELWQTIDLSSPYIKQKCKIDKYFRWLLEHRLEKLQDLNLNGWKFTNITMILSLIGTHCTDIESIGLSGWQGLLGEHLRSLIQDCPKLCKFDLSDVSPESKSANSAVSQKSILYLSQTLGDRLKSLILAHNTLSCLPQIINSLAAHCPCLQVLDLSNTRRVSNTEFALNVEQLQEGCPNLRVLRITNSNITLASVPIEKQMSSNGFPELEELSIAGHVSSDSLRITSVMDDNGLERILKKSHKLKLLDVRGCTRVTDSSLVRLPAWDLEHLYLSGCSVTRQFGSGLELIAQKWCHSLIEMDLAWSSVAEDLNAAIMAFAEKGADAPLRILNLCGSSVDIEPVKSILFKCPNLESLNLQSCRGLPRGVKRLYEHKQLIELRTMLDKKDGDEPSPTPSTNDSPPTIQNCT